MTKREMKTLTIDYSTFITRPNEALTEEATQMLSAKVASRDHKSKKFAMYQRMRYDNNTMKAIHCLDSKAIMLCAGIQFDINCLMKVASFVVKH